MGNVFKYPLRTAMKTQKDRTKDKRLNFLINRTTIFFKDTERQINQEDLLSFTTFKI